MKKSHDLIIQFILAREGVNLRDLANLCGVSYARMHNYYTRRTHLPLWCFAIFIREYNLSDVQIGTLMRLPFEPERSTPYPSQAR